jgi:cytochrome P450
MKHYFRRLIEATRSQPGDDLLSTLLQADVDGDPLTEQEVLDALFLMVVAGHETVSNLIGNAVHALLVRPARWRALVAEPALASSIVEEVLRWDSPVRHATHRITTEPVTLDGTVIPAGRIVLVALGAAGRDPARYPHADHFDPRRADPSHLGFGHGAHYCLGAALGRLEGRIALTRLSARFPHARLADDHPPRRHPSAIMNSLSALPILPHGH